ncbi:DUF349 domain-containing protein [Rufibacter sp. LB8]|uniref:DUF349 domain-containing protein n=1 Tax=Rufibacter sp. LB8 TaxID=2777781 RepID=UPI001CEF5961|nr:DUF349 domain-containing protein [Rufibacter sp. LB8]
MMNQETENQKNENSDNTNNASSQDQAQEQRRILEERLAEINSRNQADQGPTDTPQEPSAVAQETSPAAAAPEETTEAQPVEAPVVEPEKTQSSVLVSEDEITAEASAQPEAADAVNAEAPTSVEVDDNLITPEENTPAAEAVVQEEPTPPIAEASPVQETPAANTQESLPEVTIGEEEELQPQEDVNSLSTEEIQKRIIALTQEGQARKAGKAVSELYRVYEQRFNEERQEALKTFVADGGAEDDFEYHAPQTHKSVEQAMQRFRENRHREHKQEEENKTQNLQKKRELLEKLRLFIENAESQTSGNTIKELQAEWKAIGQVPTTDAQELWNSYHALLDMYYNNRSILFELKELDRKRNLDAKAVLCDRAEALAEEKNINKALQELRHLHDEWKHIGPVPNEARDQIWNRFLQASEQVHNRKKEFFEARRTEEMANLDVKKALLAEMEQFQHIKTDRINDWRDKTDQIQKLKERWDAAGLVPKEHAEEINKAFWSSYKAFFHNKNTFFKALDEEKMTNYRQKVALCEEAEAVQGSDEWDTTKEKLIQLQKKWKTIGRVPDKYSDKIWNRFRTACNAFFDRLHQEAEQKENQQTQLFAQKQEYVDQLSTKIADPTFVGSLPEFNQLHQDWQGLGAEGKKNPKLEDRFQQLLGKYLDKVPELSTEQKEQTLFKLQLTHLKSSPDGEQKLYQKEQHLRRDITSLENDISTLKTNIEFFARSKNAEKLREEYQTKIDEAQNRIAQLKNQLKTLRS